ncbi:hypothetical protein NEDG_01017 [Nematocida displodere]|uniref:EF-hand domain-containing protein n=1 Tax=Nematocida displodere TaxID=1805483 RepID=A0A177EAR0_9MICR|nr:hypothetical protein NEDG_01017 [Nematocida displodere]
MKKGGQLNLTAVLKEVFPMGEGALVVQDINGSFNPSTGNNLEQTILSCRQSKESFAQWVFSYIDQGRKGFITAEDIGRVRNNCGEMTGIFSEDSYVLDKEMGEKEFILLCKGSERFARSFAALQKHTRARDL